MDLNSKVELYNKAKEAYYAGNPIMEDFEFDALERELNLENKSSIGTRHNISYTVKHPFIMGSLSKIQVHEKNNTIDYDSYISEIRKYVGNNKCIITPKYDGCSFEAIIKNGKIYSISTRGDGYYGKDIYNHLRHIVDCACYKFYEDIDIEYCIRGEVLIDKNVFNEKYSEFVNPRSFVAGILNRDYSKDIKTYINDLSIVIYDIKVYDEGNWVDTDFIDFVDYIPTKYIPKFRFINADPDKSFTEGFKSLYELFEGYRNTVCEYALDGFVIKPMVSSRINNLVDHRPKDCVAIKFVPMLQETEIFDINWKLSKTGEYTPVVITNPVIMDGKTITRASGHNYGYLIDNNLSIGSKIILSLAGDIIPFIYKVTDTSNFDIEKINIPNNTYVDGCHLKAILDDVEISHNNFINSADSINIPYLGGAEEENIWEYIIKNNNHTLTDDFFGEEDKKEYPSNILMITPEDVYFGIKSATKNGSTGKASKIKKAFEEIVKNISLKDIIKSCNFKFCGEKVSEQCANYLIGNPYSFEHLALEGYEWVRNNDSENMKQLLKVISYLNKTFDDFKTYEKESEEVNNKIPVILTGEPNNYKSKGEFLKYHPEYRVTGSWKEVQIVFTNSLDSNTGKMKKAREKNIEIKIY